MKRIIALLLSFIFVITVADKQYEYHQKALAAEVVTAIAVEELVKWITAGLMAGSIADTLNDDGLLFYDPNDSYIGQLESDLRQHFNTRIEEDNIELEYKDTGRTLSIPLDQDIVSSVSTRINTSYEDNFAYKYHYRKNALTQNEKAFENWMNNNVIADNTVVGGYKLKKVRYDENNNEYLEWLTASSMDIYNALPTYIRDNYLDYINSYNEMVYDIQANTADLGYSSDEYQIWEDGYPNSPIQTIEYPYQIICHVYFDEITITRLFCAAAPFYLTYGNWPRFLDGTRWAMFEYSDTYGGQWINGLYKKSDRGGAVVDGISQSNCDVYRNDDYEFGVYDVLYFQDVFAGSTYTPPIVLRPGISPVSTTLDFDKGMTLPVALGEDDIPFIPEFPVEWRTTDTGLGEPLIEDEDDITIPDDEIGVLQGIYDWLIDMLQRILNALRDIRDLILGIPSFLQGILDGILGIKDKLPVNKDPAQQALDFADLKQLLEDKLGLFAQLKEFLEAIVNSTYNSEKPQFVIDMQGNLGVTGEYEIINFDAYDQYRPYILNFIAALSWFVFIKRLYRKIPNMITT